MDKFSKRITIDIANIGRQSKLTADRGLLNLLSIYATEAAKQYQADGMDSLAEEAESISHQIFKALEKSGLYD